MVTATDSSTIINVSGAIAGSSSGSAFGGSLSVNLMLNHTDAYIDGSAVKSDDGGVVVSAGWAAAGTLPTSFTLGNPSDSSSFSVDLPSIPDQVKGSVVNVSVSGTAGNWTAIAGAVPINNISNEVKGYITDSSVTSYCDVQVLAADNSTIGSGALGLSVGQNAGGATLGTSDILNHVSAYIEDSHITILSNGTGGVAVKAMEEAKIVTIAFGAAAAGNFALGGSVGVNVSDNTVDAHISNGSVVKSVGTVEVQATDTVSVFAGTGGLALAGNAAAGAALASNDIADTIKAYIDSASVNASAGDVRVEASSTPTTDSATVGAAGSFEVAVGGSISVTVIDDTTQAYISGGTTNVTAAGTVAVSAFQDLNLGIGAGGFAAAGTAAVGIANSTIVTDDTTEAYIGADATVLGKGNLATPYQAYTGQEDGTGTPETEPFYGVSVTSVSFQDVLGLAVGGAGGGTAGIAGSATVEVLNETSKAHIDPGAQVNIETGTPNADQGVNIHATNDTRVFSGAGGVGGGGAVGGGAGIDVGVVTKHTEAYIADASSTTHTFGTGAVDTVANTINVGTNNVQNGDSVVYDNGGGTSISGLVKGQTYYVIKSNANANAIQLATTKGGSAIQFLSPGTSSSQSLTSASQSFGPGAVDTTNNTITIGSSNPFTTGEAVVYSANGGTSIGGLKDGQTYYVILDSSDSTKIQLAATPADASAGHAIALTSGGSNSSQTLTPASIIFTPSDVTSSPLAINVGANNPFVSGEAVVYHKGSSSDTSIGGLTDGTTYYVVTNPTHLNQVELAASQSDATAGHTITLTSAGTGTSQKLTPVSATFGTAAVDTTNNTITIGSNNPFMLGQAVVYHNGGGTSIGGLKDGQTYYVIPDSSDFTKIQLAATPGGNVIALTSGGTSSTQSLSPAGGSSAVTFGPSNVIQANLPDTINLGYQHGFVTGQPVVYDNGGGTGIGIQNRDGSSGTLNSGSVVYYVIVIDDHTIKLAASEADATAGRAINLTSNGTSSTQSIRAVTTGVTSPTFGPSGVVTSDQVNSINTALPHGLTNGQSVVYDDGGGSDVGGLQAGHLYYAVVDPSNPNQFQLSATSGGSPIALTSHGTSASQNIQVATLGTPTAAIDPSSVILASAANSITYGSSVPYSTGEELVYDDGGGSDIGGLANGQTYYAIVDPSNPDQLQLAASADDATAGNAIPLTSAGTATTQAFHPYTLGASVTFTPSNVLYYTGDASQNSIALGATSPFQTGDTVIYNDGGGSDIGGLTNGHVYYAIVTTINNVKLLQLADTLAHANAGTALPLFSPGSSSTQSFQAVTVGTGDSTFGPTALVPLSQVSSVNLGAANPFHSGDALVYNDNGGCRHRRAGGMVRFITPSSIPPTPRC